jgi:hypothetical protein
MTAVAGLRGTGDWATDERPKNFRELILFRNPNGTAPLFALTAKIAEESVNDPEYAWWDEPSDLVRVRLNGALTNVATAVVVDSGDPSVAFPDGGDAGGANVGWGLARHLKPGDLLMEERATEPADQTNEIMMVTAVASDTAFTVARSQAGTTAAGGGIADNSFLLKIGSAYSEGSAAPDATTRNPIKFFNYTQIFKSAYEITRTASKTKTRTGDPIANDKKRKIWDHSRDIELAFMFGQRFETVGSNGKPLRFTGGLRDFISTTTTTIFGATTTLAQYLAATYRVFDWDTPAGNERIVFCGNNYLNNLNLLARLNSQVYFEGIVRQYGLELRTFSLPQGTLYLKTHPLMNRHPQYSSSAFIVDASALKYRYISDTMFEDQVQTPGQDSKKGQWLTECGLEYRFAGRTLGYQGNFIAAA